MCPASKSMYYTYHWNGQLAGGIVPIENVAAADEQVVLVAVGGLGDDDIAVGPPRQHLSQQQSQYCYHTHDILFIKRWAIKLF